VNEIAQQLAFSDLILLNKTDLVDAQHLELVKGTVRRINQSAQLLECRLNSEGGQPPLSLLLENNSFSVNKALQVDPDFLQSDSGTDSDDSSSGSDSESDSGGAAAARAQRRRRPDGCAMASAAKRARLPEAPGADGAAAQQQQQQQQQQPGGVDGSACASGATRQQSAGQAESSQQTSQTVGPGGAQAARHAGCTGGDSAAAYTKVRVVTWAQRGTAQCHWCRAYP
jgi:G3E family GTPase